MVADLVEGLGDGGGGRRGLLPRVERHRVGHERRGRSYRPPGAAPDRGRSLISNAPCLSRTSRTLIPTHHGQHRIGGGV